MTLAPPIRRGLPRSPIPAPHRQPAGHTGRMAIRYAVQADTREECVHGLEQLVALDLVPVMLPVQVGGDRWMARAVPRPERNEPADETTAAH
jgi:hypothetical protein